MPLNAVLVFRLAGSALYSAALPALMLLLAGDARWIEGWIFAGWFIGLCASVIIWLYLKDPALLAECFIAWIVLMPLDARRFDWTRSFPLWVKAVGSALLLA